MGGVARDKVILKSGDERNSTRMFRDHEKLLSIMLGPLIRIAKAINANVTAIAMLVKVT